MTKEITGRHVLVTTVLAFSVIIGVNFTLAFKAVGTFPGLEVKNSYVASQSFEERRSAQDALGWSVDAKYSDGEVAIYFTDQSGDVVVPQNIQADVGRSTVARDDRTLELVRKGSALVGATELTRGAWIIKLTATSDSGVEFSKRLDLWVR